eukprot:1160292-Pelagomonas_calceolata.AAC.8
MKEVLKMAPKSMPDFQHSGLLDYDNKKSVAKSPCTLLSSPNFELCPELEGCPLAGILGTHAWCARHKWVPGNRTVISS